MIHANGPRGWAVRGAIWLALSALLFMVFFHLAGCVAVVANTNTAWGGERGSGLVISHSRDSGPFNRIKVNGSVEVVLFQGPVRKVVVETDDNLIDRLETKTWNGLMTIGFKNSRGVDPTRAKVSLTMPHLEEVDINGSAKVRTFDKITAEDLSLSISGSGKLDLAAKGRSVILNISGSGQAQLGLEVDQVGVQINGSGKAALTGRTESLKVGINGTGKVRAANLTTQTCLVTIHGSGKATVKAEQSLRAGVSGTGKIQYLGQPKVESKIRGSGKIEPAQ